MLALRFANGIFEPIWNRQFIDHVQITVAESIGIEGRAGYYEQAGAIRDIFQNHLLQLVAITAMEPPIDFTADSVRNEKVKVLKAIHTPGPKHLVRGQYGPGFVEGEEVRGYREEDGVAPGSMTDTFVAAKLYVDNWRWADTPFYVRMGKRLARRETTIAIQFKRAPHPPFEDGAAEGLRPNVLLIHVQPNEGVSLAIGAKVPGQGMTIRTVHMDFLYGGTFREGLPDAYERLILDAMLGDATLFTRSDEIEEQWALVDAIVGVLAARPAVVPELRGGDVGAGGVRRAAAPRRPVVAPALIARRCWTGEDVTIAEIERELARLRDATSAGRSQPNLRTSVMTHIAWVPPRVADGGRGDARRDGRAASVADAAARSRARRAEDGLDAHLVGPVLPGRRSRDLRRGDRADAARRPRGGAGVDRAAAADLGSAGVLPLARRAAVRGAGRSSSSSASSTGWSSTRREWPNLRRLRGAGGALRPRRGLGHRVGRGPSAGAALLASLWPGIARVRRSACPRHACAGASARRLAALAPRPRSRSSRSTSASVSRASTSTANRPRSRPAKPPNASDVLSAQLDRFTRDPVYEAGGARRPRASRTWSVDATSESDSGQTHVRA